MRKSNLERVAELETALRFLLLAIDKKDADIELVACGMSKAALDPERPGRKVNEDSIG